MKVHIPFRFCISEGHPLPKQHQILCQIIYQIALANDERACIAGSHALEMIMKEMGRNSFTPNDVDIFTTLYFTDEDYDKIKRKFSKECKNHFLFFDKRFESRYRVDRMRQVLNVTIKYKGYLDHITQIDPPLQIIVLDNELPVDLRPDDIGFANNVVDRFDISICKCVIPNMLRLNEVVAMCRSDIQFWEMEYDMRKFKKSETSWNRIVKYATRGFTLTKLRFGENRVINLQDGNLRVFVGGNELLSNVTEDNFVVDPNEYDGNISVSSIDESNTSESYTNMVINDI
jgi:hypothetical protein